jgi:hypothetical protein
MGALKGIFSIVAVVLIYNAMFEDNNSSTSIVEAKQQTTRNDKFSGYNIDVPVDRTAQYTGLNLENDTANVLVLSERKGKSGVVYVIREVDCNAGKFRYLAEADSIDQLKRLINSERFEVWGKMSPIVKDSSSYSISKEACKQDSKLLKNYI